MNKVMLIGRLTDDVNLQYTPNGVAVGRVTLAVQRNFKNKDGDYEADFIRLVIWRKTAENLAQYQKKGDRIAVSGSIQTGSYDDKDSGKKVYTTDVRVDEVSFLSPVKNGNQQGGGPGGTNPYQQQQGGSAMNPYQFQNNQQQGNNQNHQQNQGGNPYSGQQIDISDDDLPF